MKIKTLLFLFCLPFISNSQLNCKNGKNAEGGKTNSCIHKNGKISTLETWDLESRSGDIYGYNNLGVEIFHYDLRKFAGHASVEINYYPNGQVNNLYYSSAPDGGIQFYRYRHKFDDQGKQTEYSNESQPDGFPSLITFTPDSLVKQKEIIVKKPETVNYSILFQTEFVIINETSKNVKIILKAQKNNLIQLNDIEVELLPKEQKIVDRRILSEKFLAQENAYILEFIKVKRLKFKSIIALPTHIDNKKTYTWHVIEK
jgi:hypothetical protein